MYGSAGGPVREGGPGISGWLWKQGVRNFEVTPLLEARAVARHSRWRWICVPAALSAMAAVGVLLWTLLVRPHLALALAALVGGCLVLVCAIVANLWSQTLADARIARSWQQPWTPVAPMGVAAVMNPAFLMIAAASYAVGALVGAAGMFIFAEDHDRALALGYVICLVLFGAVAMIPALDVSRRPALGADAQSLFADGALRQYELVYHRIVLAAAPLLLLLLARVGGKGADAYWGVFFYLPWLAAMAATLAAGLAGTRLVRAPATFVVARQS